MHGTTSPRRRLVTIAAATALAVGGAVVSVVAALPASAATICEQFGGIDAGNYRIMNNRWGTSATQCISTTANGFSIIQQDGTGNLQGAPTAYPAIYLGCHYNTCSPSSALPRQINTIGSANGSINLSYPSGGTWNAAYDIWINADNNTSGVQDTEIMIWLNRNQASGNIQPIGSPVGTVNIAGRSWQVWTGSNGQNNVVSYLFQNSPLTSFSFDVMSFVNDTLSRGSQYGTSSWWLTSVQAGFEPWIGGVGLTVNSFSQSVSGGGGTQPPGTPGTPTASNVTSSAVTLSWSASSGTVSNYEVDRCTGSTCTNFAQIATPTGTSYTNSGLSASTTYRYRVRATNSAGDSGNSGILTVTTQSGGGTQPPGTPGNLSASGTTSSSTNLSWSASSGTVSNYQVERCTGSSCSNFSQIATTTSTSYTNSGLSANTTYRYRVRATNSAGNSGYSNIVNVTTSGGGGGGGGGCSASYSLINAWPGGFQGEVTVTNTGSSSINGWTVTLTFPSGTSVYQMWNASFTSSGSTVTATNLSYNGNLGPNGSTTFGFLGNASGSSGATPTTSCAT